MSSTTAKYGIDYPQLADTVASLAATVQNLAGRVDLLLGESGNYALTTGAGVTHSKVITLGRTYPGNIAGSPPGLVIAYLDGTLVGANAMMYWVTAWAGTGLTITGFTLNTNWATAQTARSLNWRFIPTL